jgi:hypothetical protein
MPNKRAVEPIKKCAYNWVVVVIYFFGTKCHVLNVDMAGLIIHTGL